MNYNGVGKWAASFKAPWTARKRYTARVLQSPVAPEASHPLVEYDGCGAVDPASILSAITNSSFSTETGRLVAFGPRAVEVLVRVHNAQRGARTIQPETYAHLTNNRLHKDRVSLKELKKRTSLTRVHLYDHARTCVACNKYTASPTKFAMTASSSFVLCPRCSADRTTMGQRGLVPLAMVQSCFSGSPLMHRILRAVAMVTRDGLMGLYAGGTGRGMLLRLQPLCGLGMGTSTAPAVLNKRRFYASNDYWWSLFPGHTPMAEKWKAFAWRLSKKAGGHNRHPLALLLMGSQLSSAGRGVFPPHVDSIWGKAGDVCMGMRAQAVAVDARTTSYICFRMPRATAVCVASVACVGVVRMLMSHKLSIDVTLIPPCVRGVGNDGDSVDGHVDARISCGHPADVHTHTHTHTIRFHNGEHLTYEHLWHAHTNLGATHIVVVGCLPRAIDMAAHSTNESLTSWKRGALLHELASANFHNITLAMDRLLWDTYHSLDVQKRVRQTHNPNNPPFHSPISMRDLSLVASRVSHFIF